MSIPCLIYNLFSGAEASFKSRSIFGTLRWHLILKGGCGGPWFKWRNCCYLHKGDLCKGSRVNAYFVCVRRVNVFIRCFQARTAQRWRLWWRRRGKAPTGLRKWAMPTWSSSVTAASASSTRPNYATPASLLPSKRCSRTKGLRLVSFIFNYCECEGLKLNCGGSSLRCGHNGDVCTPTDVFDEQSWRFILWLAVSGWFMKLFVIYNVNNDK